MPRHALALPNALTADNAVVKCSSVEKPERRSTGTVDVILLLSILWELVRAGNKTRSFVTQALSRTVNRSSIGLRGDFGPDTLGSTRRIQEVQTRASGWAATFAPVHHRVVTLVPSPSLGCLWRLIWRCLLVMNELRAESVSGRRGGAHSGSNVDCAVRRGGGRRPAPPRCVVSRSTARGWRRTAATEFPAAGAAWIQDCQL